MNVNIGIRKTSTKALVVSGSVCTKSLANAVVSSSQESFWVQLPEMHELKTFSNGLFKLSEKSRLQSNVTIG